MLTRKSNDNISWYTQNHIQVLGDVTNMLANGKLIILDTSDLELVGPYRWHVSKVKENRFYAYRHLPRHGKTQKQAMHSLITGFQRCDHINHNGLDNRRINLRDATAAQNLMNTRPMRNKSSVYKGVTFNKQDGKWRAYIVVNRKYKHLGSFTSEVEAALAYNVAAIDHFGEWSYLNDVSAASGMSVSTEDANESIKAS